MKLNPSVFDRWIFRRCAGTVELFSLHCSRTRAARHFDGGGLRQVPSSAFRPDGTVQAAIDRVGYRGLNAGLGAVQEYVTPIATPARELQLR